MADSVLRTHHALSSRANRGIFFFLCLCIVCPLVAIAKNPPKRPRITGIDNVQLLVEDIAAARNFYQRMTVDYCIDGASRLDSIPQQQREKAYTMTDRCTWIANNTFLVDSIQTIGLSLAQGPSLANAVESVTFATDNLPELRRYLLAQGLRPSKERKPDTYLTVRDPEGHLVAFVQRYNLSASLAAVPFPLPKLIHAGFIVHNRDAEEHFYKDILGFHLYWRGGMKDGETDWVDMQVPDGTDWIEFMLNVPENADKHLLGVMNHIALGVPDVRAAAKELESKGIKLSEAPQIGRDGKWQLNLYDPDGTRVELMEFTPVEKPCCSEYTGPHPKP
jgi:catechol 2,3-dioxygenase-like lactoylglutathione lyase family enzyme